MTNFEKEKSFNLYLVSIIAFVFGVLLLFLALARNDIIELALSMLILMFAFSILFVTWMIYSTTENKLDPQHYQRTKARELQSYSIVVMVVATILIAISGARGDLTILYVSMLFWDFAGTMFLSILYVYPDSIDNMSLL